MSDDESLEERVNKLESTVSNMLPSRRQFLTGAAAAGGFMLGSGSATAADTSDGRFAGKVMQTRAVHDQNDNTAIDLPGDGSINVDEINTEVRVGPGDTIQAAHDGLPSEGGRITIESDYDNTDSFPVNVTKPVIIAGVDKSSVDIAPGNTNDNVFAVDFSNTTNASARSKEVVIRDLRIEGGSSGIVINTAAHTRIKNIVIRNTGGSAIALTGTSSLQFTTLVSVDIVDAAGEWVAQNSGTKPHAMLIDNCSFRDTAGSDGVTSRGFATVLRNSSFSEAQNTAVDVRGGACYITECYFEDNHLSNNVADINLRSDSGHHVGNSYFNGQNRVDRAININGASDCNVYNCAFQKYTGGLVQINGGSDNDINAYSHAALDSSPVLDSDSGTRTRSGGVIGGGPLGGVDLSTTTGQFEGDLAMADGTSTASKYANAVWDSANTHWEYTDPTGTV